MEGWRGEILQESLIGFLEGKKVVRVGNVRRPNPLVFEPFPRSSSPAEPMRGELISCSSRATPTGPPSAA